MSSPAPVLEQPAAPAVSSAAATWALFLGLGLLMTGNGLGGALVGIRAELEGFGTLASAVVMTGYFVGFLLGTRVISRWLVTVGHIRVFAALASTASTAVLVHLISVSPATWFGLRAASGFCMAGLYVVVESWLNELATNETRGRILAVYMVVSIGGMAVGQLLIGLGNPLAITLFILSSVLVSASLVPVTLSASSTPPPIRDHRKVSIGDLVRIVPTGAVVSLLGGVGAGVLIGMGAIWATSSGVSPQQTAIVISAPLIGGVIFQWPIGWLSDRLPRRGIILGVALGTASSAFAAAGSTPGEEANVIFMFLLGGLLFPLYSLGLAYSNDWLAPEQRLGAASTLITVNGSGAVVGPLIAGGLMSRFGAASFFHVLAAVHLVMAAYIGVGILIRDAKSVEEQEHYPAFPTRGTAALAQLWVKRRRPESSRSPRVLEVDLRSNAPDPVDSELVID